MLKSKLKTILGLLLVLLFLPGIVSAGSVRLTSYNNSVTDQEMSLTTLVGTNVTFGAGANQTIIEWDWTGVQGYTDNAPNSTAYRVFNTSGTFYVTATGNSSVDTLTWTVIVYDSTMARSFSPILDLIALLVANVGLWIGLVLIGVMIMVAKGIGAFITNTLDDASR